MKSCSWHDSLVHTRFTSHTHAPQKNAALRAQDSVWAWGLSPPKGLMLESPLPTTRPLLLFYLPLLPLPFPAPPPTVFFIC